jgi:TonB family protein
VEDTGGSQKPGEKTGTAGEAGKEGGAPGGTREGSAQFAWYHQLIHDRFYAQWEQPTSLYGAGKKFLVQVEIRIERNGTISSFEIIKESGNFVMDESVRQVGRRVQKIEPLPEGLGSGGAYTIRINFELD